MQKKLKELRILLIQIVISIQTYLCKCINKRKNKYEFVFANLPDDMVENDRIKLLKWYKCFGDKGYEYDLSEHSIIGRVKK